MPTKHAAQVVECLLARPLARRFCVGGQPGVDGVSRPVALAQVRRQRTKGNHPVLELTLVLAHLVQVVRARDGRHHRELFANGRQQDGRKHFAHHQHKRDADQQCVHAHQLLGDALDEHGQDDEDDDIRLWRQLDGLTHVGARLLQQVGVQLHLVARPGIARHVQRDPGESVAVQYVLQLPTALREPEPARQIERLLLQLHLAAQYLRRSHQDALPLHDREALAAGNLRVDGVGVKLHKALVRFPSAVREERAHHDPQRKRDEDEHDEEQVVVHLLEEVDQMVAVLVDESRERVQDFELDGKVRHDAEEAEDEKLLVDLVEDAFHLTRDDLLQFLRIRVVVPCSVIGAVISAVRLGPLHLESGHGRRPQGRARDGTHKEKRHSAASEEVAGQVREGLCRRWRSFVRALKLDKALPPVHELDGGLGRDLRRFAQQPAEHLDIHRDGYAVVVRLAVGVQLRVRELRAHPLPSLGDALLPAFGLRRRREEGRCGHCCALMSRVAVVGRGVMSICGPFTVE
eukprot:7388739-Prymnesium_polylepis.1